MRITSGMACTIGQSCSSSAGSIVSSCPVARRQIPAVLDQVCAHHLVDVVGEAARAHRGLHDRRRHLWVAEQSRDIGAGRPEGAQRIVGQ